jgi:hypothetical protein
MSFVFSHKEPEKSAAPADAAKTAEPKLPVVVAQQEPSRRLRPAAPTKETDNRRASRKSVRLAARVGDGSQQSFSCTVHDMSAMGAMLELHPQEIRRHGGEVQLPERFYLVMENLLERSVVECYVVWRLNNRAGIQFVGPIDSQVKRLPARKPQAGKGKPTISIRR